MACLFYIFNGVGLVRVSLDYDKKLILSGLSAAFLIGTTISSSFVAELLSASAAVNKALIHLPLIFFSTIMIGWSLLGAYETMEKLREHNAEEVLEIFHQMATIISISWFFFGCCDCIGDTSSFVPGRAQLETAVVAVDSLLEMQLSCCYCFSLVSVEAWTTN